MIALRRTFWCVLVSLALSSCVNATDQFFENNIVNVIAKIHKTDYVVVIQEYPGNNAIEVQKIDMVKSNGYKFSYVTGGYYCFDKDTPTLLENFTDETLFIIKFYKNGDPLYFEKEEQNQNSLGVAYDIIKCEKWYGEQP